MFKKRTLFKFGIPIVTVFVILLFVYSVTNENTPTPVEGINNVTTFSNDIFGIKNLTYPDTWNRTNNLNNGFENVFGNTAIRLKPQNNSTIDVGVASNPITRGPDKDNTTRYLEFIAELSDYQNITYTKDEGNTTTGEPISSMTYEYFEVDNSTEIGKVYAIATNDKIYYMDYYVPHQFFDTLVPYVDKMAKSLEIDPTVTISDDLLYESYSNESAGITDIKYPHYMSIYTEHLTNSVFDANKILELNSTIADYYIEIGYEDNIKKSLNLADYFRSSVKYLTDKIEYGKFLNQNATIMIDDNVDFQRKVILTLFGDRLYFANIVVPKHFSDHSRELVELLTRNLYLDNLNSYSSKAYAINLQIPHNWYLVKESAINSNDTSIFKFIGIKWKI